MKRPMPPADLGEVGQPMFAPAPLVLEWIKDTFLEPTSMLHNPDHDHVQHADLGVLWAAAGYAKQQRYVAGTMQQVMFRTSGWDRWKAEEQLRGWFAGEIPDFLMTLDATYSRQASDVEFCALVEHELYHLAQAKDDFGSPVFGKDGRPKFCMRGHDVEEFVGVVARYGANDQVKALVAAANAKPRFSAALVHNVCGTCLERAA